MRYWTSRKPNEPDDLPRYGDLKRQNDLVDYPADKAIIGDVRNDDNILISQLHLAFLKLHNRFVRDARNEFRRKHEAPTEEQVFTRARQLCEWHYQYVIVNDYLPRIVGWETIERVRAAPDERDPSLGFRLYTPPDDMPPPIPVEFSAAAFRFGHSMIRSH